MSETRVIIAKSESRSKILNETITAYVDNANVSAYIALLRNTFPKTDVSTNGK